MHRLFLPYLMCGPEADNRILAFINKLLGICGSVSFIFIIVSLYVEVDCVGRRKTGILLSVLKPESAQGLVVAACRVETTQVSFCFNSEFHTARKEKSWFEKEKKRLASVLNNNPACQILKGILVRESWSLFSSTLRTAFPCEMHGGLDG